MRKLKYYLLGLTALCVAPGMAAAQSSQEFCERAGGVYNPASQTCLGDIFNSDLAKAIAACERYGATYSEEDLKCYMRPEIDRDYLLANCEANGGVLTEDNRCRLLPDVAYLSQACADSGGVFNETDGSCSFDEAVNEYLTASCGNAGGIYQEGGCRFEDSGIPERAYFTSQVRQLYESRGDLYSLTFFVEQDFYAQQALDERNFNLVRLIQRVYGVKSDVPGACLGLDACENVNGGLIIDENPTSIWIIFDVTDNYGFEFVEGPDGRYYLNSEIVGDLQQISWENSPYTVVTKAGELLSERIYLMYRPQLDQQIQVENLQVREFEGVVRE